jgi:hypothetical protein
VDFLEYRKAGYCTLECSIGEPRGIPSNESIIWKDKTSNILNKERLPKPQVNSPLREWTFDMVHYPPPKGWQIENWRLVDE